MELPAIKRNVKLQLENRKIENNDSGPGSGGRGRDYIQMPYADR